MRWGLCAVEQAGLRGHEGEERNVCWWIGKNAAASRFQFPDRLAGPAPHLLGLHQSRWRARGSRPTRDSENNFQVYDLHSHLAADTIQEKCRGCVVTSLPVCNVLWSDKQNKRWVWKRPGPWLRVSCIPWRNWPHTATHSVCPKGNDQTDIRHQRRWPWCAVCMSSRLWVSWWINLFLKTDSVDSPETQLGIQC